MGVYVFLFGIVFGSYYSVIAYRVPIGMSMIKGRSMCETCRHTLHAKDLVPIFSWLFLRGRCRYCGAKIPPRYPVVELITGCLFVFAYLREGYSAGLFLYAAFWSMLIVVTLMDYDHMIISEIVLLSFTLICAACLVWMKADILDHLLGCAVGFGAYLIIFLIAKAVYKKEAFGFGDVELMASIGLILGLRGSVETVFLSFYVALMGVIIMKILGKAVKRKMEMPFGPYMCVAAFLVSLYGQPIYDAYLRLILGK